MDLGLAGKVAIVTGSGRGIGLEIARMLAEEKARVVISDIVAERAESAASQLRLQGADAIALLADVTDGNQVTAMVRHVAEMWDGIDILVNNAGIPAALPGEGPAGGAGGQPFTATERSQWDRTMGLITYGVLTCSHAVLPYMVQRHYGRIINIISDAGRVGEPRLVAYSMAKAGVVGFTKALAKEVGRSAITVNCVSPSATITEATAVSLENPDPAAQERLQGIMRQYPMARALNRLGMPTDVAYAVTFLASERAAWITGQVLSVNGGYAMVD